MTASSDTRPYDFRKPRQMADDVQQLLSAWVDSFLALLKDRWHGVLNLVVELSRSDIQSARRRDLAVMLEPVHVCYSLGLGPEKLCMWLVLSRPFLLGAVATILGDVLTELPADRPLTDLENSLVELALQQVATSIEDSQPTVTPLHCLYIGDRRIQDVAKDFSEDESAAVVGVKMAATFGEASMWWCLSQNALLNYIDSVRERQQSKGARSAQLIDTLRQIPLDLVVQLGTADVHVSELLNLQPGDILVLNQRVSEPLAAQVCGNTKFLAWPGRLGSRQALRVASTLSATTESWSGSATDAAQ